jgi:hypothetical protein|tara:strand:- start:237 stop:971 length:735 start_codon:yes stop_codon:yes gene_type:complete
MSFESYMNSLGANRVPIGYGVSTKPASMKIPGVGTQDGQGGNAVVSYTNRIGYGLGAGIQSLTPMMNTIFKERGFDGQHASQGGAIGMKFGLPQTYAAHYSQNPTYTSGYVDSSGGFLGYGNSLADLQNNNELNNQYTEQLINEPARLANLESQRLANEQAALNLQQRREARRAAESNNPQFTRSGLVGMGQQGMAPQQMAPQQFGRAAVPGMGRGTGQGIGRGTGQGLLGGLHRGAAPTGGGQ